MGYLYRPKPKSTTPSALGKGQKCRHEEHGKSDVCPGCEARFGKVWWVKYYVNGTPIRESTGTESETEAKRFLKAREGKAAAGHTIIPRVDRIRYEEAAEDLRSAQVLLNAGIPASALPPGGGRIAESLPDVARR